MLMVSHHVMGRRNKDISNQSELLVDDTDHEGGVVYHTMPTSSSAKKRKLAHNLCKAGYVYEVDNYTGCIRVISKSKTGI